MYANAYLRYIPIACATQWNDGDEEPSCSWRQFYARNPCVPIDYSHVADAVAALGPPRTEAEGDEMPTMTIWLRPQEHRLQESLLLQAGHAKVTLETMTTTTTHKKRRPLASLLLQTRRRNKPLLHIAAGHVTLRRIRLGHYCGGLNLCASRQYSFSILFALTQSLTGCNSCFLDHRERQRCSSDSTCYATTAARRGSALGRR